MSGMRDSHGRNLPRVLGIPDEAERVLVVTESSHWDPNWLLTSEEYYRWRVRRTLDAAIDELLAEPTRVYSVECVFFFRLYWERNPHRHEVIRELVAQRRLRFTGPGVTTPDTLLPTDEAVLRDLAIGQAWLHDHGLAQEPEVLYLPDSFGHSPCLPTLLRAAGLRYTCVTRIDGMYMDGTDWEPRSKFPRPSSLAERLWSTERSLDFVWRDPWGSEVLAHWHAFTYGQGDLLAGRGISRWMGLPLWVPDRSDRNVVRKVEHFAQQLASRSRTRYLCCPIGFDFVGPVHHLSELIARWNDRHYGRTGLWLLNAGLDDYFRLIELHQSELPVIDADPNPYWTGFYSARPRLKQVHARLVDALLATEAAAAAGGPAMLAATAAELGEPWYVATVANHHDFVTGTSPNRVARREQYPWLDDAHRRVAAVRSRLPDPVPYNAHAEVDAPAEDLEERLAQLALCLIAWEDTGGLWRMGHEFRGGHFREVGRLRTGETVAWKPATARDGAIECVGRLEDREVSVLAWLEAPLGEHAALNPILRLRVTAAASTRRAVTLRLRGPGPDGGLRMAVPGGWIDRPRSRIYHPTFWSLNPWAVVGVGAPHALALASSWPTAVSADGEWVDIIVARNARRERAFGFLPLLATPAAGDEPDPVVSEIAIWHPSPNGLDPAVLSRTARAVRPALTSTAPFELDRTDLEIGAVTAAPSLDATVLRIRALSRSAIGKTVALTVPSWIDAPGAWIADVRGRRSETADEDAPWVDNEGRLRVLMTKPYTTLVLPYRSWT